LPWAAALLTASTAMACAQGASMFSRAAPAVDYRAYSEQSPTEKAPANGPSDKKMQAPSRATAAARTPNLPAQTTTVGSGSDWRR